MMLTSSYQKIDGLSENTEDSEMLRYDLMDSSIYLLQMETDEVVVLAEKIWFLKYKKNNKKKSLESSFLLYSLEY